MPLPRRPINLFMWPFGVASTSWSYIWRTTPIHRRELKGSASDMPPGTPPGVSLERAQLAEVGVGPLFHRTYTGRIVESRWNAQELMERVRPDPNFVAPIALARFKKTQGPPWQMEVGDEFVVRMPGPWDGPIRAVQVHPCSFRFITLEGHLEAGQIEWRAQDDGDAVVFQIESWARLGDQLSRLMHDHLRMAKEVQLHMWTSVVEKVAKRTGGRLERGIDIDTRRLDAEEFEAFYR